MSSSIINKFTVRLFLASNDGKLLLLLITSTLFYSSQDSNYSYKLLALTGWYMAILLKVIFDKKIKIKFYYWTLLPVAYEVWLNYLFFPS
jgi:hypothetical protein